MNTALLYTLAFAAFIVTIMGGVLLAVLMFYGIFRLIASIWERTSAAARNKKEYLLSRSDFELYKKDVARWDDYQRACIEKCQRCEYRRKAMEERLTEHGELLEMLPRIERWEDHTHDKK